MALSAQVIRRVNDRVRALLMGDPSTGAAKVTLQADVDTPSPARLIAKFGGAQGPAVPSDGKPAVSVPAIDLALAKRSRVAAARAVSRYDAAVCIQKMARAWVARRIVRNRRNWLRRMQLRGLHWARRLQRFVRRRWEMRRWTEVANARREIYLKSCRLRVNQWQARVRALRAAREALCAAAGVLPTLRPCFRRGRPPYPGGVNHPGLLRYDAAVRIQSVGRCARARAVVASVRRAVALVQGCGRIIVAKARVRYLRELAGLRSRRMLRRRVEGRQRFMLACRASFADVVNTHVLVNTELASVDAEIGSEIEGFETAWAAHEQKLLHATLKSKLGEDWIEQDGVEGGLPTYLNLRTGTVHTEHPLMRRARQLCTQHRDEALPSLQDRLQTLVEYRERLDTGSKERVVEDVLVLARLRASLRTMGL